MKRFLAAALPGAYSSVRYLGEGSSWSIVLPPHDYALEVPRAISCLNSECPYLTPANAQTGLPVALWACHACFLLSFSHVAITGLKLRLWLCWKHTGRFPAAGIGGGVYLLRENPVEAMQSSVGYHALPA